MRGLDFKYFYHNQKIRSLNVFFLLLFLENMMGKNKLGGGVIPPPPPEYAFVAWKGFGGEIWGHYPQATHPPWYGLADERRHKRPFSFESPADSGVFRGGRLGAPPPLDALNIVKNFEKGKNNLQNSGSAPPPELIPECASGSASYFLCFVMIIYGRLKFFHFCFTSIIIIRSHFFYRTYLCILN